jgi:uncharacterized protein YbjT (DUF2867 family)
MKFLVTGANGFIGSVITENLLTQGHHVVAVGRSVPATASRSNIEYVHQDFQQSLRSSDWSGLLDGVDGVINCAGILRESRTGQFDTIHEKAPLAIAQACNDKGVRCFVQISALGDSDDADFIASKHRFDEKLLKLLPTALVLRPSVVVSLRGSYGGSSMLRGLAAFPEVLFIPGSGQQQIQPILLEDLAILVLEGIERSLQGIIELGGPEAISIKDYMVGLRGWLQIRTRFIFSAPFLLVQSACLIGERLKAGPLNQTVLTLLESGNVVNDPKPQKQFTHKAVDVIEAMQYQPSFVQDRWHAKLFLLQPIIWFLLSVIWLLSAVSGFSATQGQFAPILSAVGFPAAAHSGLVMLTSILDLVLGLMLIFRFKERITLWLMLFSTVGYSVLLGMMAPELWLDPLGGLLKNLAVVPLIMIYMVMRNPR